MVLRLAALARDLAKRFGFVCILKYVIVNLVGRNLHLVDIFIYDIYIHIDIGT